MHPEIGKIVQTQSDKKGIELSSDEILSLFKETYFEPTETIRFVEFTHASSSKSSTCELAYKLKGETIVANGEGNGPIDACKKALMKHYPNDFSIASYSEHSYGKKSSAKAIAYIEIKSDTVASCFGVGADNDIATASIKALFSALNRAF